MIKLKDWFCSWREGPMKRCRELYMYEKEAIDKGN